MKNFWHEKALPDADPHSALLFSQPIGTSAEQNSAANYSDASLTGQVSSGCALNCPNAITKTELITKLNIIPLSVEVCGLLSFQISYEGKRSIHKTVCSQLVSSHKLSIDNNLAAVNLWLSNCDIKARSFSFVQEGQIPKSKKAIEL